MSGSRGAIDLADRLAALLPGLQIHRPGSEPYADSLSLYNLKPLVRLPECVVWPDSAAQLAALARVCRAENIELPGLRSGGNDTTSSCASRSIMVDLSPYFTEVEVFYDAEGPRVRFQAGCRIVDIESRVLHDLPNRRPHVTPLASWPALGTGSIVNTGGFGLLSRTFGLAIDNLVEAEVITDEGDILSASSSCNPDLFARVKRLPQRSLEGDGDIQRPAIYCVSRFVSKLYPVSNVFCGHLAWETSFDVLPTILDLWSNIFNPRAPIELNSTLRLHYVGDKPAVALSFLVVPSDGVNEHQQSIHSLISSFDAIAARSPAVWTMDPGFRPVAEHQQVTWRLPGTLPSGIRQHLHISYIPTSASLAGTLSTLPKPQRQLSTIHISLAGSPVFTTPPFDTAAYEIIYNARWRNEGDDSVGDEWVATCR